MMILETGQILQENLCVYGRGEGGGVGGEKTTLRRENFHSLTLVSRKDFRITLDPVVTVCA